jgi:serine/threonine-protein kinase
VYAWAHESDEEQVVNFDHLQSGGPVIAVAALAGIAAIAAVVAGVVVLLSPHQPTDHFTIQPAPVEQPAPKPAPPAPKPAPPAPKPSFRAEPQAEPPMLHEVAPAPQRSVPQLAPAPTPQRPAPDADQTFIGLVSQIPEMKIVNPAIAEADGRNVCTYLQDGHSRADANASVLQNDPTFTRWQAAAVVNAAITAYCPQYLR